MEPKKLIKAFQYAFHGFKDVFQMSPNFRWGLIFASITITVAFLLQITLNAWIVIVFTIALVLSAEAVNTAVERLLDFFHPERHPEIKHVKDIMAGAVVIVVIAAFFVGLFVFVPYFVEIIVR